MLRFALKTVHDPRNSLRENSCDSLFKCFRIVLPILIVFAISHTLRASEDASHQWAQWRGPLATGVAPFADPPTEWSETKNIRWKIELPGKGHSTPVVWDDRIFITTAIAVGDSVPPPVRQGAHDNMSTIQRQDFVVMAINRLDGKTLWQKTVNNDLPQGAHQSASFASNSPVTDGECVYAFFGSSGLYCLDMSGEIKWHTSLGQMHALHGHGEGNSPALSGDTLIVNWDHEGPSFIVALDKHTGHERWRTERDEVTSWSTPIVVENNGAKQIIVAATHRIRGYDFDTGKVIWECGGMSTNVVASPVAAAGMVYAGSSYEKRSMFGIRLDGARGDITGTAQVAWSRSHDTPYVPSPLLYDDKLYFLKHYQAVLFCITAKTGEPVYGPVRLPGLYDIYASPVAAAGRIYITSREGKTVVLKHGPEPEILAQNELDEKFSASPALVGKELFLRGEKHLYSISNTGF
ncbi:MAG TPA: PQQ-binding-like beta-propeller repeat protein [Planctomycetota bacterium]|nr:PQQ-binding-like beta-propeller repeat protein [Planctomycetota bacterium]